MVQLLGRNFLSILFNNTVVDNGSAQIQGVFLKSCKSKNSPKLHFLTNFSVSGLYVLENTGATWENTQNLFCLHVGPTIGVESQKQKSTYVVFRNFRDIIHNRGAKAFLDFFSRYEYLMGLYGKITCPQTKKEPLIVEKNELDCVE